jgi:hypothetical protein
MHDGGEGSTSGYAAGLPDLAPAGESLLPSLPASLGAIRKPETLDAYVVNYADDLVICCCTGNGSAALATMRHLMTRLGLTVNEAKTRLARLPEENFDFLGYSIGRFYGKDGVPYIGTRPSRKAIRRLLQRIHDATTPHKHAESPELRIAAISRLLRGWAEYFNQGPVLPTYKLVRWYVQRRYNAGWYDAADKRAPDTASIRTSISTSRSASTPRRVAVPTCRARRPDDARPV